jgi:hypothetical protein
MAKYTLKTKEHDASVNDFIATLDNEVQRNDCKKLLQMMQAITKEKAKMWGPSIIGFGKYHYRYASGHEGDMCLTGFSPRKQNMTVYILPGFENHKNLMRGLGKYKIGKSCLYFKKMADINEQVLKQLIETSVHEMKKLNHNKTA